MNKYLFEPSFMRVIVYKDGYIDSYKNIHSNYLDTTILSLEQKRAADRIINAIINSGLVIVNIVKSAVPNKYILETILYYDDKEYRMIFPDCLAGIDNNRFWDNEYYLNILKKVDSDINIDNVKMLFSDTKLRESILNHYSKDIIPNYEEQVEKLNKFEQYINFLSQAYSVLVSSNDNNVVNNMLNNMMSKLDEGESKKIIKTIDEYRRSQSLSMYILSKNIASFNETADAFNAYMVNPVYNIRNILHDLELEDYREAFGRYHLMYPKFKVFFREEDTKELLLLDEVYSFSDIVSIEIASELGAASKTAKIVLSNVLNRLTDESSDTIELFGYSDLSNEQNIETLNIQPGMTIIICGGYENYIYNNELFVGKIVEIYPGPALTIVAQSFGAELLSIPYNDVPTELKLSENYGDYGDIANDVLNRIDAVHFGDINIHGFNRLYDDPGDLKQLNAVFKILLSKINIDLDSNRDINVYLVKSQYFRNKYKGSKYKSWWITPDQTTWDVLNELALYKQDYVVLCRNYNTTNLSELRETVYVGPKNGFYIKSDLESFKINMLRDRLAIDIDKISYKNISEFYEEKARINNSFVPLITSEISKFFANSPLNLSINKLYERSVNIGSKEHMNEIIKDIMLKETILGSAIYGNNGDPTAWLVTENVNLDLNETKEVCTNFSKIISNRSLSFFENIRSTHFLSSSINIISNNISINGNFNNKVVLQFPKEQPHYDMRKIAKTAGFLTLLRNKIMSSGSGLVVQEFTLDDNIKPENIREYITYQKNIDTQEAECGGNIHRYILKREIDSLIENSNTYNADFAKQKLIELADKSKDKSASKIYTLGENPFALPESMFVTADNTIKALNDPSFLDNIKEFNNIYIPTANGRIQAKEYYLRLLRLGLTHKQAITLMHIANIRHPKWYTVGRNILALQCRNMYDGTITIIGDLTIKEGDRCVLFDLINNIYGIIDVKAVSHMYSQTSGFTTTITPALVTYLNDRKDIFDGSFLIGRAIKRTTSAIYKTLVYGGGIGAGIGGLLGGLLLGGIFTGGVSLLVGLGVVGGSIIGGLSSYGAIKHEFDKMALQEAKTVYGRHAIGFIPLLKSGKPYTGGIGGFRRSTFKSICSSKFLKNTVV